MGVYRYDYDDLQVDFFNSPIFAYQTVTGDARTQGIEAEFRYAPRGIDGLLLRGSANYNEAKYTRFDGPCYAGQTPAQGCTLVGPSGAPFQNLDDVELSVAPKWTAALGGDYETRFGNGLRFGISLDARYSSDYLSSAFGLGVTRQDSYVDLSASIRLGRDDDRWEVALLGRNLGDEFYATGSNDGPSTGSGTGTPAGVIADQASYVALPRTVQAQLTVRF